MVTRQSLGWFSTFDPLSRSAFFSQQVIPSLVQRFDLTVVYGDRDSDRINQIVESYGIPACHYLSWYRAGCARAVINLEDSPVASDMLAAHYIIPGISILHDTSFERLYEQSWARSERRASYERAEHQRVETGMGEKQPPFIHAVSDLLSSGVVTKHLHGRGAVVDKTAVSPERIVVAPFATPLLAEPASKRREGRMQLGIAAEEFVVATSARSRQGDRVELLCELASLDPSIRLVWFILDNESERLADTLRKSGTLPASTVVVRPSSLNELSERVAVADCFAGLQFDTLRELPAGVFFAMAAGVPTTVFEFGPGTELPNAAVCKLTPGRGELEFMTGLVGALRSAGGLTEAVAANGRAFIETVCSPSLVAADISRFVMESFAPLDDFARSRSGAVENHRARVISRLEFELARDGFDLESSRSLAALLRGS